MTSVPAPKIDKRRASDHLRILLDAPLEISGRTRRGLRAELVPEWKPLASDEPLDFGLVVARLFARLMDTLIERINRIPEKHFTAFLDLLGVERLPGSPARVPVTFTPAPRTPSGRNVPAGTQVATTQSATQEAKIFETEEGFDLTPVELSFAYSIDAAADRYRDVRADLEDPDAGSSVILSSVSGDPVVEHALYIGHDGLLAPGPERDVLLRFSMAVPAPGLAVCWERFDGTDWVPIDLGTDSSGAPVDGSAWLASASAELALPAFAGTESSELDGRSANWIRARLVDPLTAGAGALPEIARIRIAAIPPAGLAVAPDAAFTNSIAIDLNRDFHPFGAKPARNDAFYVASREAFVNPEPAVPREISINIRLAEAPGAASGEEFPDPSATAAVTWEYWSNETGTWRPIVGLIDATNGFKVSPRARREDFQTVSFELPTDLDEVEVNGVKAPWIRARITAGDYGREATSSLTVASNEISSYTYTPASFRPPFISVSHLGIAYGTGTGADPFVAPTACASRNHFQVTDHPGAGSAGGPGFRPFQTLAGQGETAPALYLGYSAPFGNIRVSQLFDLETPDPEALRDEETEPQPRLAWEYRTSAGSWRRLDASDGTRVLANTGTVAFTAPSDMAAGSRFGQSACWIRARLEGGALAATRTLRGVYLNTVWAKGISTIADETLGSGSGEAPQTMQLSHAPVLPGEILRVKETARPDDEELAALEELEAELAGRLGVDPVEPVVTEPNPTTGADETWVRWYPVPNFRFSDAADRHYTIDRVTGEVTFGAMPVPLGRDNVIAESYVASAGDVGDAGRQGMVAQLKSPLPFVASISNPVEAAGGSAPDSSLEEALDRGPSALKHRGKAVTIEDFEALAREASTSVARVRVLPVTNAALENEPGAVTLVIVPWSAEDRPTPQPELVDQVRGYLADRAVETITHRIYVLAPSYVEVGVSARVVPEEAGQSSVVVDAVAAAVTDYLHPLSGGRQRTGWDFGRPVHLSEIYTLIEQVPGVDHVEEASFAGAPGATMIPVGAIELVASGEHTIEAVSGGTGAAT